MTCTPRLRADGWRLIGGCHGPQPDWTWTLHLWPELDKSGDETGNTSRLDYAICPDCDQLWERTGGTPIPMPESPLHLQILRDGADSPKE